VLEWWRRVSQARDLYRQLGSCGTNMESVLRRNSITHVVVAKETLDLPGLRQCLGGPGSFLAPRFENRRFLVLAAGPVRPRTLLRDAMPAETRGTVKDAIGRVIVSRAECARCDPRWPTPTSCSA
jgi:hypothetical protein